MLDRYQIVKNLQRGVNGGKQFGNRGRFFKERASKSIDFYNNKIYFPNLFKYLSIEKLRSKSIIIFKKITAVV